MSALVGGEFDVGDPIVSPTYSSGETIRGANGQYLYVWEQAVKSFGGRRVMAEFHDEQGEIQGPPFALSAGLYGQRYPMLAFEGEHWVVAWSEDRGTEHLAFSRVSPNGTVLDDAPFVAASDIVISSVSIASNESGVTAIAWSDNAATRAVLVNRQGEWSDPTTLLSQRSDDTQLAYNGSHFLLATRSGFNSSSTDVLALRFTASGVVLDDPPLTISTTDGAYPGVGTDGDGFLVTSGTLSSLTARLVDAAGNLGSPFSLAGRGIARVAYGDGRYLVQSRDYPSLNLRLEEVTVEGTISQSTTISTPNSSVRDGIACTAATCFICYDTGSTLGPPPTLGTRIDEDLNLLDEPPYTMGNVAGAQEKPVVEKGKDGYFVAWVERRKDGVGRVWGTRLSSNGHVLDSDGIQLSQNTTGGDEPSIAFNGTNYLVTWTSWAGGGEPRRILATRVSATGEVLDSPPLVVHPSTIFQKGSTAASDGNDFLVLWQEGATSLYESRTLYGRIIGNDGSNDGVVTAYSGDATTLSVSDVSFNGTHYLIGMSTDPDGIIATRVSSTGAQLDSPALILGEARLSYWDISVASDGQDFIVAWSEDHEAVARRVSSAGTTMDPTPLVIESDETADQPRVAFSDGQYWVIWSGQRTFESGTRLPTVYGRRLDPSGEVIDEEPFILSDHHMTESFREIAGGPTGPLAAVYTRGTPEGGYGVPRTKVRLLGTGLPEGTPCDASASCASGTCDGGTCRPTASGGASGGTPAMGGGSGGGGERNEPSSTGGSAKNGEQTNGDKQTVDSRADGMGGMGGAAPGPGETASDPGGCGCRMQGSSSSSRWPLVMALLTLVLPVWLRVRRA